MIANMKINKIRNPIMSDNPFLNFLATFPYTSYNIDKEKYNYD